MDTKSLAVMILNKVKPKEEEKPLDVFAGKEAAMEKFLVAISAKDTFKMAKALKSFYELCEYEEDMKEEMES